jgi:hypothetical protein
MSCSRRIGVTRPRPPHSGQIRLRAGRDEQMPPPPTYPRKAAAALEIRDRVLMDLDPKWFYLRVPVCPSGNLSCRHEGSTVVG